MNSNTIKIKSVFVFLLLYQSINKPFSKSIIVCLLLITVESRTSCNA